MENYNFGDFALQILRFVHRVCTSSWVIRDSKTSFIDLTYVLSGTSMYFINGRRYKVTSGDLLCVPKGSERFAKAIENDLMTCYSVDFNIYSYTGEELSLPFPIHCHVGSHPDIISLYRNLDIEWLNHGPCSQIKATGILFLILHRYFELIVYNVNSVKIDKRIKKVLCHISENYADPITIQDMAKLTDLNPVYLGNLFKQCTGMTFRQYLISIRLNHAEEMLRNGACNVNETALLCGFPDAFYFSKVFKENKGVCPSKLKKSDL